MTGLDNLLPATKKVLVEISDQPAVGNYTFVGGSALAVYLNHRKSEDIDLFSEENKLSTEDILNIFGDKKALKIINTGSKQLDVLYNGVKITFFAYGSDHLRNSKPFLGNIQIADLELLSAMKVNALFLMAKFRDYYDIYVLNKEKFTLQQLFDFSVTYIPGISKKVFQTALTFTDDIEEDDILHLTPRYNLSKKDIENHFIKQIKTWNKSLK
jgi:predicted nucleotidyltransferase component of viral defense system